MLAHFLLLSKSGTNPLLDGGFRRSGANFGSPVVSVCSKSVCSNLFLKYALGPISLLEFVSGE